MPPPAPPGTEGAAPPPRPARHVALWFAWYGFLRRPKSWLRFSLSGNRLLDRSLAEGDLGEVGFEVVVDLGDLFVVPGGPLGSRRRVEAGDGAEPELEADILHTCQGSAWRVAVLITSPWMLKLRLELSLRHSTSLRSPSARRSPGIGRVRKRVAILHEAVDGEPLRVSLLCELVKVCVARGLALDGWSCTSPHHHQSERVSEQTRYGRPDRTASNFFWTMGVYQSEKYTASSAPRMCCEVLPEPFLPRLEIGLPVPRALLRCYRRHLAVDGSFSFHSTVGEPLSLRSFPSHRRAGRDHSTISGQCSRGNRNGIDVQLCTGCVVALLRSWSSPGEKDAWTVSPSGRSGGPAGEPSEVFQRRTQSLSQTRIRESSRLKAAPRTGSSCRIAGNAAAPPGPSQSWTTPPRQVRRRPLV